MSECNCSMRQQLVGDGCHICNPEKAKDLCGSGFVERLHDEAVKLREKAKESAISEHQPSGMMMGLLANAVAQNYEEAAGRIEELESRELGYIQSLRELEARVRELESAILDYMAANREVDEGSDNFNGEIDALNACWVKMTRIVDPPKAE